MEEGVMGRRTTEDVRLGGRSVYIDCDVSFQVLRGPAMERKARNEMIITLFLV